MELWLLALVKSTERPQHSCADSSVVFTLFMSRLLHRLYPSRHHHHLAGSSISLLTSLDTTRKSNVMAQ